MSPKILAKSGVEANRTRQSQTGVVVWARIRPSEGTCCAEYDRLRCPLPIVGLCFQIERPRRATVRTFNQRAKDDASHGDRVG